MSHAHIHVAKALTKLSSLIKIKQEGKKTFVPFQTSERQLSATGKRCG